MHVLFVFTPSGWPTIVKKHSIEYLKIDAKLGYRKVMEGTLDDCREKSKEITKELNNSKSKKVDC